MRGRLGCALLWGGGVGLGGRMAAALSLAVERSAACMMHVVHHFAAQ